MDSIEPALKVSRGGSGDARLLEGVTIPSYTNPNHTCSVSHLEETDESFCLGSPKDSSQGSDSDRNVKAKEEDLQAQGNQDPKRGPGEVEDKELPDDNNGDDIMVLNTAPQKVFNKGKHSPPKKE